MNLNLLDWSVFVGLFLLLVSLSFLFIRCSKSVAGFLVAERSVGRFLGLESDSLSGLGAITILALWQQNYNSGFVGLLWYMLTPLAAMVVALTGFGIYRFRQTRAMTLGQFVEMRYDRKTRILFGLLAYAGGVLNMGIFPATVANFFVSYCGFSPSFTPGGLLAKLGMTAAFPGSDIAISTAVMLMIILNLAAIIICFNGGQVTVVVTNFAQALFINAMLVGIMIAIYKMFTWQQVSEAFLNAPNADALLHPFSSKQTLSFGKFFFLIGVWNMIYWVISWSPNSLVTSSARDAHEAKMMRVFVELKKIIYAGLGIGILPLAVFVLMHHPDFSDKATQVTQSLEHLTNVQERDQMLTAAALKYIMPAGIMGAFAGFVLFAFMSTQTSYLLAWGGILIQDVVLPLRRKPLKPKAHMMLIRLSVLLVAVFITWFSIQYKQAENLYMFMDLTGGLYLAGAGVVLLLGLYWKRGTVAGAWTSLLTGFTLTFGGFLARSSERYGSYFVSNGQTLSFWIVMIIGAGLIILSVGYLRQKKLLLAIGTLTAGVLTCVLTGLCRHKLPNTLDGRMVTFYASMYSIVLYFLVSEFTRPVDVDLDEILNRRRDEIETRKRLRWYQFMPEVPFSDRILIPCLYGAIILFVITFVGAWIYCAVSDTPIPLVRWMSFWHIYVWGMFILGFVFLIWVILGGFRDIIRLLRNLRTEQVNVADDGSVEGHHAAGTE